MKSFIQFQEDLNTLEKNLNTLEKKQKYKQNLNKRRVTALKISKLSSDEFNQRSAEEKP